MDTKMLATTTQIRNLVENTLNVNFYGTWTDTASDGNKLMAWRIGCDGDELVNTVKEMLADLGYSNRVKTTTSPQYVRGGGDTYLRIKAAPATK
jgi:hypothetical protein